MSRRVSTCTGVDWRRIFRRCEKSSYKPRSGVQSSQPAPPSSPIGNCTSADPSVLPCNRETQKSPSAAVRQASRSPRVTRGLHVRASLGAQSGEPDCSIGSRTGRRRDSKALTNSGADRITVKERSTSAFGGKADITNSERHVRLWHEADI